MNPEDYIEKFGRGYATVAMTDTNGLLRGQLVSTASLAGILRERHGHGASHPGTRPNRRGA